MLGFTEQKIDGSVALVIGGSKGIGYEIARGLAERDIVTIIAARGVGDGEKAARELSGDGRKVTFHRVDLADEASIEALAAFVKERFGRLDILVNDAALAISNATAMEATTDELRKVFEVNVFGTVAVIQALADLLEDSPAGRIVNISSERGSLTKGEVPPSWKEHFPPQAQTGMASRIAFVAPPGMAYSMSKTMTNAITQHFAYAFERAGSRVKINSAAPGHCATPFNNFRGWRSAAEGAQIAVALSLIDESGPNGGFFRQEGKAPW